MVHFNGIVVQYGMEYPVDYFDDASNPYSVAYEVEAKLIIGIGNNEVRKRIVGQVQHSFATIIHPTAYVLLLLN